MRKENAARGLSGWGLIQPWAIRFFAMSLVAGISVVGYLLWSSYQDAFTVAQTTTRNIAWVLESRLDATLRRVDNDLQEVLHDLEQHPEMMDPARQVRHREGAEHELDLHLQMFPEVLGMRVFDAKGDLLYTSGHARARQVNVASRDYFIALKNQPELKRYFSEVIVSRVSKTPTFVIAYPVRSKTGEFLGLASAAIDIAHFTRLLDSIELGPQSIIGIRRSDNFSLVLSRPAFPELINQPLPVNHPNRSKIEAGQKVATTDVATAVDGVQRVFTLHALDRYPYYVLVGISHADLLKDWYSRLAIVIFGGAWVVLLGLALVLSLRNSLIRLRQRESELKQNEQRFRTLFDETPVGHVLCRQDMQPLAINRAFSAITGYSQEEILQLDGPSLIPESERKLFPSLMEQLATQGRVDPYERHFIHKDGHWVPVRVQGCTIQEADGAQLILSVVQDISEQKRAEERIRLLASVFQFSGEAIVITDVNNRIIEVNAAFTRMTGYAPEEIIGKDPKLLASGRTSAEEYRTMWRAIVEQGHWQGELWDLSKDGLVSPKWTTISTICDSQNQITHYIAHFIDITERKAKEEQIHYLAHHDALTRLPNRLNLQGRLEQALATARRLEGHVAVMFVDLDRFKMINDSLGHHIGDDLLMEVALRLRDSIRASDVVARLGGDEFIIVLTDIAREDAALVAEKVLDNLAQPCILNEVELHTTPSIGIALFPEDGTSVEELMKNADSAMYHAKASGRNNYQFFHASMNADASERLQIESTLRQALARNEFVLHYQPQIDAGSGAVMCVEALIRWQHPERGMIPPLKFIPVAEETGLIGPIGAWVLEEALRQLKDWREAGIDSLRMAVNLSAKQLRDKELANHIATLLKKYDLQGSDLELEITESVAMHDPDLSAKLMHQLHSLGVELAIDDFGTGYSSLAYLKLLPLDRLKLDRSFVTDIERDPNDAAICSATISLAHSLHLAVVAEGVETATQRDYLKALGCNLLQGYLFSKPLPAAECEAFIRHNRQPSA